jgi:hypothetical protein
MTFMEHTVPKQACVACSFDFSALRTHRIATCGPDHADNSRLYRLWTSFDFGRLPGIITSSAAESQW